MNVRSQPGNAVVLNFYQTQHTETPSPLCHSSQGSQELESRCERRRRHVSMRFGVLVPRDIH